VELQEERQRLQNFKVRIRSAFSSCCCDLRRIFVPVALSLALGLALALVVELINGLLIAFADIPAIFATLAMGTTTYGFGRTFLVETYVINLTRGRFGWLEWTGGGEIFGIPAPVVVAAAIAVVTFLFLRFTRPGRFLFAIGDNPISAVPARPPPVAQYIFHYRMVPVKWLRLESRFGASLENAFYRFSNIIIRLLTSGSHVRVLVRPAKARSSTNRRLLDCSLDTRSASGACSAPPRVA
jgi:hypothetical protein